MKISSGSRQNKDRKIIEQILIVLWDIIKWLNICVIGVHMKREKRERGKKKSLKKTVVNLFQRIAKTPDNIKTKKATSRYIIIKMLKINA